MTVAGPLPLTGEPVTITTDAFEARALQHELDHCTGLLFLDRVTGAHAIFSRKVYLDPGLTDISTGPAERRAGTLGRDDVPGPRQRRFQTQRGAKALLVTLAAALAAAPLAVVWGIGHAQVEDYLGPHRADVRQQLLRRAAGRPRSHRQRLPAQPDRPARRDHHRPWHRRAGRVGRLAVLGEDPRRVRQPVHRPRWSRPRHRRAAAPAGRGRGGQGRGRAAAGLRRASGSGTAGWRRPWLGG